MSKGKEHILILDEGQIILDKDRTYTVYGEVMFSCDIVELDLEHICWLDQIVLLQDLAMNHEISIMYHPQVVSSLHNEAEASPYWGKDRYQVEAQFKRSQTKVATDEKLERKLLKPVEWTPTMRSKKGKVTSKLVEDGYDRVYIRETLNRFLAEKGEGYMNLTVNQIAEKVDEFARDVADESGSKYISSDSTKPCTLYLLKFSHKKNGEEFIKPGITRRGLGERFAQDKKYYEINVLHTVTHTTSKCVTLEKEIQKRFDKYRFHPKNKLANNGTTECLSLETPHQEIIDLMGTDRII